MIHSNQHVIIASEVLAIGKSFINGNVYYGCSVQRHFTPLTCHYGHIMYIPNHLRALLAVSRIPFICSFSLVGMGEKIMIIDTRGTSGEGPVSVDAGFMYFT
jgi:hypothetical protein